MNINHIKLIFDNLTLNDKIEINYYGALPIEFEKKYINYSFSYGTLFIEDLLHDKTISISMNTIKSITTSKINNIDGLSNKVGAKIDG